MERKYFQAYFITEFIRFLISFLLYDMYEPHTQIIGPSNQNKLSNV